MSSSQVLLCLPRFSTNKPNKPHCGRTLVKELAVTQPNIFCALSTAQVWDQTNVDTTSKTCAQSHFKTNQGAQMLTDLVLESKRCTLQVYILCTMKKKKKNRYAWLITLRSDHETLKTSITVVQVSFSRDYVNEWTKIDATSHKIISTCNTQKFKTSPH